MLTDEEIEIILNEADPEAVKWDGFDKAIIGTDFGGRLVYSIERMKQVLMEDDNMTDEDAMDFLCYNTFGTHVGDFTPIHVYLYTD